VRGIAGGPSRAIVSSISSAAVGRKRARGSGSTMIPNPNAFIASVNYGETDAGKANVRHHRAAAPSRWRQGDRSRDARREAGQLWQLRTRSPVGTIVHHHVEMKPAKRGPDSHVGGPYGRQGRRLTVWCRPTELGELELHPWHCMATVGEVSNRATEYNLASRPQPMERSIRPLTRGVGPEPGRSPERRRRGPHSCGAIGHPWGQAHQGCTPHSSQQSTTR